MRISQLSERVALPVGTVKFYLRTGLLHHGRATSATQAVYDESHVERLRLIRALLEVGGLSHADIQRILEATTPGHDAGDGVLAAHHSAATPSEEEVDLTAARAVIEDLGWQVADSSPHLPHLARALAAVDAVGLPASRERIRTYADAAVQIARTDLQSITETDAADRPRIAATGAVLFDQVLSALHRLAFESQATREGATRVPEPRTGSAPTGAERRVESGLSRS
jgi:DNA-binding transcriptional MerR regulator